MLDPAFLKGQRADIFYNGTKIGGLGVLHPNVLANYHVPFPCSALELNIEPFV